MRCKPCPHPKKFCWCIEHPGVAGTKTIQQIKKSVSKKHGVLIEKLESSSRKKPVVAARNEAMAECRKYTSATLAEIGEHFNRGHATVLHGINKFNEMETKTPWLVSPQSSL